MIGFQFIILLLWCRPRRDIVLTQQLAKMEIQLDLLKNEISQLNESKVSLNNQLQKCYEFKWNM